MPTLSEHMDQLIALSYLNENHLEPHQVQDVIHQMAHHEKMEKHHKGEMERRTKLARVATNIGQHEKAAEHTKFAVTHASAMKKHKGAHSDLQSALEKHYESDPTEKPKSNKPVFKYEPKTPNFKPDKAMIALRQK